MRRGRSRGRGSGTLTGRPGEGGEIGRLRRTRHGRQPELQQTSKNNGSGQAREVENTNRCRKSAGARKDAQTRIICACLPACRCSKRRNSSLGLPGARCLTDKSTWLESALQPFYSKREADKIFFSLGKAALGQSRANFGAFRKVDALRTAVPEQWAMGESKAMLAQTKCP